MPQRSPARGMRVVVTRPASEASAWVAALSGRGWMAVALPLIEIGMPRGAQALAALERMRAGWQQHSALMFVSAAAVQHFFSNGAALAAALPGNSTRFWAPGPGTAHALALALSRLGVDPSRIDAPAADAPQFDSEHLWPVVQGQMGVGARLLVVRGASTGDDGAALGGMAGSGRDWLMQQCRARGACVQSCVAYERLAPVWSATELSQALALSGPDSVWLFSSSQSVAHLRSALQNADWSKARALCTHARIARAAQQAGFGRVVTSRPALEDVLSALESAQSTP